MPVSIDEVSAEIAPPNDGDPTRGRSAPSDAPASREAQLRRHCEFNEHLARRAERVSAD